MCVEALACGRPVFGAQVGGIPEIIHDPVLGWLAPTPFRTDQIVQTLLEIDRESTVVRHRRSAACRNSAELRFSLELMTNRYLALYQELLVASRARRPVDLNVLAGVGV
jgi:glycosyltransferase involved in cell wall biosynthesis